MRTFGLCVNTVRVLMVAVMACSVTTGASAQDTTGTIAGRIVDAQGLAVPGVTVTATGPQGAKTTLSDGEGRFTVPFLTPGPYSVHTELQGFNSVDRSNVDVRLGQTIELTMTMQVGSVSETVQVAGSSPTLDTTSTTIGASLDASATRSTSHPASARVATSEWRTRRSADPAASRTSTSSMA
jgi:Carboxypeptidase regulatory-like domain